jgi:RimK family alpha-L-glutamate ligase
MARIVIFADQPDWHSRKLLAAFAARGAEAAVRSLRDCVFAIEGEGPGLAIPGYEEALPEAVLVKNIAGGSFEQVTLRLGFLHALGLLGIPVVNDARAIERCVDKSMTSFLLHRAGIPTPPTYVAERDAAAEGFMARGFSEWVAKPLFGAQGKGLKRLAPGDGLPPAEAYAGVRYLQHFVGREEDWRDYRVMVISGEPIAAMVRRGRSWVTNVRQGGTCEASEIRAPIAELSRAAAEAVGTGYAGIDVIEAPDGALFVLEANSMPAWRGLQGVADCDIAQRIADHVLARLD